MEKTHEPGATKIGMRLRALLLDTSHTGMSPRAEALMYAADRAEHVASVIAPALARGAIVITDRYVDSSLAYQGAGRDLPVDEIARFNRWATGGRIPDLTILLDMDPMAGLSRRARSADRLEAEPADFHLRVRAGFLALARAEPDRYLVLDADRPPAEITRDIQERIRELLPDPVPSAAEASTGDFPAIRAEVLTPSTPFRTGGPRPPFPPGPATGAARDRGFRRPPRPGRGRRPAPPGRRRGRPVLAGRRPEPGAMTHAWLFTGPPGSGRSVAARAFAAALLCDEGGCNECNSCRQVFAGTHADLLLIRPEGLSYGVKQTRDLVLRAAGKPTGGRWQIVLFEDADRCTEQAANALLKAIEEPAPRTVWLLCAPSAEDLVPTIRSRCRVVTLVVPSSAAVAQVLTERDGIEPARALAAARAAQGHIGRARRLAVDPAAAKRRADVLRVPSSVTSLGPALSAAAALVRTAEEEAKAVTEELDEPEREALRRAFGEGSSGKGVAKAMRGMAGAMKDLEDRQKSRATRVKRDTLDQALLELALFYRDILMLQLGAGVELANPESGLRKLASASTPEATLRRLQAIMHCRELLTLNVAPLLAVEEMALSLSEG